MRFLVPILVLALVPVSRVWAQVSAEIILDQDQFVRDESVPVKVRITNLSGQTLQFGKEPDWLTFSIASRDNTLVAKEGEVPVMGEFTVNSAFAATKRVDLAPYFDMSRAGRYEVTATVKIKQWETQVFTKPKAFYVGTGAKIWERIFGIPTTNGLPEIRKYTLQQTTVGKRPKIYIRVTDENEVRVFKVFPLGPVTSFAKPEKQLDKFSNLHVLFQDGAQSFNYSVVNPYGELRIHQTHTFASTSHPRLREDDEGFIRVIGGQRLVSKDDVPPPTIALATNDVTAAKP
jgi:hypothetical protein